MARRSTRRSTRSPQLLLHGHVCIAVYARRAIVLLSTTLLARQTTSHCRLVKPHPSARSCASAMSRTSTVRPSYFFIPLVLRLQHAHPVPRQARDTSAPCCSRVCTTAHAQTRRLSASWCTRPGEQACSQLRGHIDKRGLGDALPRRALSGHAPAQACCNRCSHGRPPVRYTPSTPMHVHMALTGSIHVSVYAYRSDTAQAQPHRHARLRAHISIHTMAHTNMACRHSRPH